MCHSMQELPCVESFVTDYTVMVVGSMKDPIICGQLKFLKDCRTGWVYAIQLFG